MIKQQKLRVKGLPGNLPEFIEIKIDELEIGKSIVVKELSAPNIVLLDSPNNPVVIVKSTRAAVTATSDDGKKKK